MLNRYYGLFEDGKFKVRGIELRKRDTTQIVRDMQDEMLSHFAKASDAQQFIELIPSSLDIVQEYVDALRSGTVPLDKLLVTRSISQGIDEYQQFNDGVAALMQLDGEGFDVSPGEAVRYLVRDSRSRDHRRRVKVDSFISGDEEYDASFYTKLLLRGAEGLLLPFGYDLGRLCGFYREKP